MKADPIAGQERLELAVVGDRGRGTIVGYRHGYSSRRTTTEAMVQVETSRGSEVLRIGSTPADNQNPLTRYTLAPRLFAPPCHSTTPP